MFCSFRTVSLLAVVMTAAAGCVSFQSYRTHPELPQRTNAIRNVGLLPPTITMYQERTGYQLVPHHDWSREAAESLSKAFVEEMAADRLPLTLIGGEDRDVNDMADLFRAVDFSIARHAYDTPLNETFPEKMRSFDYSLGPARELMERHQVDAVWMVTGYNLLPTLGTRLQDFLGSLPHYGASGGLIKFEIRAALVDKSGTIVFHSKLTQENIPEAEEWPATADLRDAEFARHYVRVLLSQYQKARAR